MSTSDTKKLAASGLFGGIVSISTFFVVLSIVPQQAIAAIPAIVAFTGVTYKTFKAAKRIH